MTDADIRFTSAFAPHIPTVLKDLLGSKGLAVIQRVGTDEIRRVIADVLCGRNLRDSTEMLTRRRVGMLNAATFVLFLRGVAASKQFVKDLHSAAAAGLKTTRSREEKWLLQWILGLTDKGVQNVLRDSPGALDNYVARFSETIRLVAMHCREQYGEAAGDIQLADGVSAPVTWELLLNLFCTVGSQTLAVRGSEKSTYGKLFERLILGAALELLGFELVDYPPRKAEKVFWLASKQGARECDATALVGLGRAVRFDIGFIGRGNPEISKDKLSRFERQIEVGDKAFYSATIVVVDRIGERSTIAKQASAIGASIVQMSMSYWPQQLARVLKDRFGFESELCDMPAANVGAYIRKKAAEVRIERYLAGQRPGKPRQRRPARPSRGKNPSR